jgi:agmatine deiminase
MNTRIHCQTINRTIDRIRLPADWEPHVACLMAWAVSGEWKDWVEPVKDELALVIQTISEFEPIWLLAPPSAVKEVRSRFKGCNVEVIEAPVSDIWMRDIAPNFAVGADGPLAIDWNFRGWGATASEHPVRPTGAGPQGAAPGLSAVLSDILGVPCTQASFVAEGGAFITDGQGTLVTTRSCLLNPNRNPSCAGTSRQSRIERALRSFGINKVIWLEGDPCEPITSGHVDGYVMFAPSGHILVESVEDAETDAPPWRAHDILVLEQAIDAAGHLIQVKRVHAPRKRHWKYRGPFWAPCYLNAYIANGAVITACFGDSERDLAARNTLQRAFPERAIVMLSIDHVASGGGGIRCLTQPIPDLHC